MKGAIIAAGIFVACCAAVFGQAPIVTLQNQESSPFYYVIDPEALAGLSAGSPQLATRVADFFAASEGTPAFVSLAPDGQVRIEGLPTARICWSVISPSREKGSSLSAS